MITEEQMEALVLDEFSKRPARESFFDFLMRVAQKARILATDEELRALKSQQDAAIESKQAEQPDTQRLDFMLANTAFTVACNRDGSILQYQLMMQDEDEECHVLHNERRFYNTEREAIDAAIESQRSGDGS